MIRLSEAQIAAIGEHGAQAFPLECCGVMLGDVENGVKIVRELRPLPNTFEPDAEFEALGGEDVTAMPGDAPRIGQERRYLIAPDQMFALMQEERRTRRKVLGFYHSHPNHPAQPSIYDFQASFAWYTYIIVSVMNGAPAHMTAWQQDENGAAFVPEEIEKF